MSDFINVTNEVALATLADPTSAAKATGKSLLADGVIYESDGVSWDPVTIGDYTTAINLNSKYRLKGDNTEDITTYLQAEFDAGNLVLLDKGEYLVSNVRSNQIYLHGTNVRGVILHPITGHTGIMLNVTSKYDIRNIDLKGTSATFHTSIAIGNDDSSGTINLGGVLDNLYINFMKFGILCGNNTQHPLGLNINHVYAQAIKVGGCIINGDGSVATNGEDCYVITESKFTNGGGNFSTTYVSTVANNTPNDTSDTVTWTNAEEVPYFGYTVFRSADGSTNWHVPPNWFKSDYKTQSFVATKQTGETWFYKVLLTNVGTSISRAKNITYTSGHSEDFVIGHRFTDCPSVSLSSNYFETRLTNYGLCAIHSNNSVVECGPSWCEGASYAVICASNSNVKSANIKTGIGVKIALFGLAGATQQNFEYSGAYNSNVAYSLYKDVGGSIFNHNSDVATVDANTSTDYVTYPTAQTRLRRLNHFRKAGFEVAYRGTTNGGLYSEAGQSYLVANYVELQPHAIGAVKVPIQSCASAVRTNLSTSAATAFASLTVPSNNSGTVQFSVNIAIVDSSSVSRQVFGGVVTVSAVSASGTVAAGIAFENSVKAVQNGTLTVPTNPFTVSVSGSVVTISCVAIDATVTSLAAGYAAKLHVAPVSMVGAKFTVTLL